MVARTMFLRAKVRKKDGKRHRYFSVVENRRVGQNHTVQQTRSGGAPYFTKTCTEMT